MADITRHAEVVWKGNLLNGEGSFSVGSGSIKGMAVSWPSRVERPGGNTSPEELIAAAHASCYSMALAHTLTEGGHPPEWLNVSAVVTFAPVPEGGFKIAMSELSVRGTVPGLDQAGFEEWARKGEAGCPVSNALRGNVAVTVSATLDL